MIKCTQYVCEHCGNKADSEEEILACEYRHQQLSSILRCREFTITEEHLKLLHHQNVKYGDSHEYGATEIDPKRPYGNSWVENDIAAILDIEKQGLDGDEPCFTDKQNFDMWKLHVQTSVALEICLQFMKFEIGTYVRDPRTIMSKWKKVSA